MDIKKARELLILGKTIYDMDLRVANYSRVSTDKEEQLNSLENQLNYFDDLITNIKPWTYVGSYKDEGISGTKVCRRESFLRMIEDARLGKIDLILTKEVSRFARNTIDSIEYTQQLLKYGVAVFFISDNINTLYPDSEFRLAIMASMAQDEVRKLSQRVKFGIKRSIKDRKVIGGPLYGYDKNNCKLFINEMEKETVRMLFTMYSSGLYGFKKISDELAKKGLYTKKGRRFSDTTLKKMIRNPKYKGYYTANMTTVEDYKTHKRLYNSKNEWIIEKDYLGNVPAIVSESLWNKANEIYEQRHKKWNSNLLNKEYYLEHGKYTSKMFCKEHNKTFIRVANGKRKKNPVWQCNDYLRHGLKGCQTPILYEKDLDDILIEILSKIIDNKEKLLDSIVSDYMTLINKMDNKEAKMNSKLLEQQKYKERILEMSLNKMISDEEYLKKSNKINSEIESIEKSLTSEKSKRKDITYYKKISSSIKKEIKSKLEVRKNIGIYLNLFVNKIFISKVNNDRKHVKIEVILNINKQVKINN